MARAGILALVHRRVGSAGVMEFFDLLVGGCMGFVFGALFTVWWYAPSEMDRR